MWRKESLWRASSALVIDLADGSSQSGGWPFSFSLSLSLQLVRHTKTLEVISTVYPWSARVRKKMKKEKRKKQSHRYSSLQSIVSPLHSTPLSLVTLTVFSMQRRVLSHEKKTWDGRKVLKRNKVERCGGAESLLFSFLLLLLSLDAAKFELDTQDEKDACQSWQILFLSFFNEACSWSNLRRMEQVQSILVYLARAMKDESTFTGSHPLLTDEEEVHSTKKHPLEHTNQTREGKGLMCLLHSPLCVFFFSLSVNRFRRHYSIWRSGSSDTLLSIDLLLKAGGRDVHPDDAGRREHLKYQEKSWGSSPELIHMSKSIKWEEKRTGCSCWWEQCDWVDTWHSCTSGQTE